MSVLDFADYGRRIVQTDEITLSDGTTLTNVSAIWKNEHLTHDYTSMPLEPLFPWCAKRSLGCAAARQLPLIDLGGVPSLLLVLPGFGCPPLLHTRERRSVLVLVLVGRRPIVAGT